MGLNMMQLGELIIFEGIDGVGKTTQIKLAYEALKTTGYDVVVTKQPGGTPLGTIIRDELLSEELDNITELMMFAADRHYHIDKFIHPHIEKGTIVLCDRYIHSTIAYQGSRINADHELIEYLISKCFIADLTVWLDRPDHQIKNPTDMIEGRGLYYMMSVHGAYQRMLKDNFMNMIRVEAGGGISETHDAIMSIIYDKINLHEQRE
jgi:dTMP kinase